jgi:hypothetical protein
LVGLRLTVVAESRPRQMRKRSSRTSVRYGQPEPLDFRQRSFRRHRPFGYALTLRPFLKVGIAFGAAAGLAFAADTLSITVMEIVDNAILLVSPQWTLASPTYCSGGSLAVALAVAFVAAFRSTAG